MKAWVFTTYLPSKTNKFETLNNGFTHSFISFYGGLRFEVGSRRHPRIAVLQHQIHGLIPMLCKCLCGNVKIGNSNFNYWELDQNLLSFVKFN